jgi:hypothetical protein
MHVAERIALWTVIVLIIFFLFFRNSSGFTASQPNLMYMNEFSWIPTDIKNSYASNMTKIINAIKPKMTAYWTSIPAGEQQKMLKKLSDGADEYVTLINTLSADQLMSLKSTLANKTSASPSPIAMAMAAVQAAPSFPTDRVTVTPGPNFTGNLMAFSPPEQISFGSPLTVQSIYVPTNYKAEFLLPSGLMNVIVGPYRNENNSMTFTKVQVKN